MISTDPVPAAALGSRFVHPSPVHFDELDAMAMLHNARYAVHVERATSALFAHLGWRWELDATLNPDQFHVVREVQVEFLAPFRGMGFLQVELWVEKLGETSCVYGFECFSEAGVHARGRRTVVKLEPATQRPARWTERFRDAHAGLRRAGSA
jgi:acyl-CoA thioester hydrolase